MFLPERLIIDNALIALETFHSMKKSIKEKQGFFALKLGMSKAYDKVEWGFLRAIMSSLGFHVEWIDLVMHCISTVSYSLLVNGKLSKAFYHTRGPLSPYLFLLCAEAFALLLNRQLTKVICMVLKYPGVLHRFLTSFLQMIALFLSVQMKDKVVL